MTASNLARSGFLLPAKIQAEKRIVVIYRLSEKHPTNP